MLCQESDCRTVPEARLKPRDRAIGDGRGSGKAAGEDSQDEKGSSMSQGDEVDQFAERKTRTSSPEDTGGPDQPDGRTVGPLGFFTHSLRLRNRCLRESCIRENRTCSLSGGRWLARKRASSDPTPTKQPNESVKALEEAVEGRTLTKENVGQPNPRWTPSQKSGHSGLDRVREAARKDGK